MRGALSTQTYIDGVRAGDRRLIAKTITLLESRRADHSRQGQEVLEGLSGNARDAVRLGITGAPGVGKSSFIETLGMTLIEKGHRLAVLAVDPSSPLSGGSILGDKTRMLRLSQSDAAYIRPSASGGTLGGVAHRTREAILVFEAAGFDVVIVETVGVGQSEAEVASMVDFFCVLLQPGAGDELQGIKKGVIELADAIVVNKADGDAVPAAEATCADYAGALSLLRARSQSWTPVVQAASAQTGSGVERFWETVLEQRGALDASGERIRRRSEQARAWLWRLLGDGLERAFREDATVAARLEKLEAEVESGALPAPSAARALLDAFRGPARG